MLTRQQTEAAVALYVEAAMRAAFDDWSRERHAAYARDMIARGMTVELYRLTDRLWLA